MQIGFNNDVEVDGTRYHIQTEDLGLKDGRITSQIFRDGQIIDTMTVSYAGAIGEIADPEKRDEVIRKRMKALHALCFRNIRSHKYDREEQSPPIPEPASPERESTEPYSEGQPLPVESPPHDTAPDKDAGQPKPKEGRDVEGDPTSVMSLPDGVTVAGTREELGEDYVEAHSRGLPLEVEELALEELSDAGLMPLDDETGLVSPEVDENADTSLTAQLARGRRGITYVRDAKAFRGLDVASDDRLIALLAAM